MIILIIMMRIIFLSKLSRGVWEKPQMTITKPLVGHYQKNSFNNTNVRSIM